MRCALRTALLLVGLGSTFLSAAGGLAAPPWRQFAVFKRIEADKEKDYRLTEDCGPWMIMAVTFSGELAEEESRTLVYELRKKYKLPAYTYEMELDFSKPFAGRGVDEYGAPRKMKHLRDIKTREIAVLVGDYNAVDDPAAQETLDRLRYAHPECLKPKKDKATSRTLGAFREIQKTVLAATDEWHKRGPMGHAFMTANPLLPPEYFAPKGLDPFVVELNEAVENSLLECPGRYSVQVAMFTGTFIQTQSLADLEKAKDMPSKLEEAADKAHRMAQALREKGYEAYEFHDRYSSVVCVGSFDTLGNDGPNGQIELHPAIVKIMDTFGAPKKKGPDNTITGVGTPRTINTPEGKIPFDIQPVPVEVPKKSTGIRFEQARR
jgi:hypothetical protein